MPKSFASDGSQGQQGKVRGVGGDSRSRRRIEEGGDSRSGRSFEGGLKEVRGARENCKEDLSTTQVFVGFKGRVMC